VTKALPSKLNRELREEPRSPQPSKSTWIQPPAAAAARTERLTGNLHRELNVLLEAFVLQQKGRDAPWLPLRQPKSSRPSPFCGLSPVRSTRATGGRYHSFDDAAADDEPRAFANEQLRLQAALGSTTCTSFEVALQSFCGQEATDADIEAMIEIASPMISWRKREWERSQWVRAAHANLADAIRRAFAIDGSASMLYLGAFTEAATMHWHGVDQHAFRRADMRNLQVQASLQRADAVEVTNDSSLHERFVSALAKVANTEGLLSLESLLDAVSEEGELRSEFEAIVNVGCARRHSMMHGYWRSPPSVTKRLGSLGSPRHRQWAMCSEES